MSGVYVYLHDCTGDTLATSITDQYGFYEFTNLSAGNYTVTFFTDQPAGGVELDDANLVLQYLDGDVTFTPVQELAADVNGSGNITHGDYQLILNRYLNRGKEFPIGPWIFEPLAVTIPTESRDGFVSKGGSSSGDVNGNLQPDPKSNPIFISNSVEYIIQKASAPIVFNLTAGQEFRIAGMHMVIKVPAELEIIGVESTIPQANIYLSENNQIRITWLDESATGFGLNEGESLLSIQTKAREMQDAEQVYHLTLSDESHLMDVNGLILKGVTLMMPTLSVRLQQVMQLSVYPNPFISNATIEYQLPEEGNVMIALFDQAGRQVMELNNTNQAAGANQVKIDGSDLIPGIYHYSVEFNGNTQEVLTGTIIKSK
jgi:hypothetical protein